MEQMKQRQAQVGQQPGSQGGAPGQARQGAQGGQPGQQAGAPPQTRPAGSTQPTRAEQLKTSLEGIKQSADYLLKSSFVK
jgi:hypothetical protein